MLLNGAQVRLAPLYDVASALPYDDMYLPKLKMAMRIGGEYTISRISRRHWARLADANGLDPEQTVQRIDGWATRIADAFRDVVTSPPITALGSDLPARLLDRIAEHALACRRALARD